jgi:hypothetical protein
VSGSAYYSGSYEVVGKAPDEVAGDADEVVGKSLASEAVYEINFGRGDEHRSSSGFSSGSGSSSGDGSDDGSDDDDDSYKPSLIGLYAALSPLWLVGGCFILLVLKCYLRDIIVPYFKKLKWKISNKLEERNLPIKNSKLNSKFIKKLNKENLKQITAKAKNTTLECTICIDNINLTDYEKKKHSNKIVIPNCGHIFHTSCLNTWVRSQILNGQQPTCPTCRAVICDIPDTKSYTVYNASYDSDGYSSGGWLDDL